MGMFKQMKQMKGMIEDAPEMIRGAQGMGAQAQEMAAAQQAAAQQQMAALAAQQQAAANAPGAHTSTPVGTGAAAPIAGVSIELYAEISKGLAAVGYDQSQAVQIAAARGVSAESWQQAMTGWNQQITANPAIAKQFNTLYREA